MFIVNWIVLCLLSSISKVYIWPARPSTCLPPKWMQRSALDSMLSIALLHILFLLSLRLLNSSVILLCKSWRLAGGVLYTLAFKYPHRKKSNGARSGDLGGHSTGWPRPTTLPGNSSCNRRLTTLALWHGAPSWKNQTCGMDPFWFCAYLPTATNLSTIVSLMTSRYLAAFMLLSINMGPIRVPLPMMPPQTTSFPLFWGMSYVKSLGGLFRGAYLLTFRVFTFPLIGNTASSPMMTSRMNLFGRFVSHWQYATLLGKSAFCRAFLRCIT